MKKLIVYLFTAACFILTLAGCKEDITLGIRPRKQGTDTSVGGTNCRIRSLKRSDGVEIGFKYEDKLVTEISGFPGFDKLIYDGRKLVEAKNSLLPDWKIKFQSTSDNQITGFTINGRDGSGRLIDNSVTFKYDKNNRIIEMTLNLQIIQNAQVKLEYDANGNLTSVKQLKGNKYVTVLENTAFDDLKSPFTDSPLRQIIAHFAIYNVLIGDTNYTNILCTNNPTESIIYSDKGNINLNVEYDEQGGYASKASISKNAGGRFSAISETYDMLCGL